MDRRGYKGSKGLIIKAVWNRSFAEGVRHSSSSQEFVTRVRHGSSTGIVYASSRHEEPEEVTGLCDVIGNVISDCKHRLMYIQ
jgi:hypothetical protein